MQNSRRSITDQDTCRRHNHACPSCRLGDAQRCRRVRKTRSQVVAPNRIVCRVDDFVAAAVGVVRSGRAEAGLPNLVVQDVDFAVDIVVARQMEHLSLDDKPHAAGEVRPPFGRSVLAAGCSKKYRKKCSSAEYPADHPAAARPLRPSRRKRPRTKHERVTARTQKFAESGTEHFVTGKRRPKRRGGDHFVGRKRVDHAETTRSNRELPMRQKYRLPGKYWSACARPLVRPPAAGSTVNRQPEKWTAVMLVPPIFPIVPKGVDSSTNSCARPVPLASQTLLATSASMIKRTACCDVSWQSSPLRSGEGSALQISDWHTAAHRIE